MQLVRPVIDLIPRLGIFSIGFPPFQALYGSPLPSLDPFEQGFNVSSTHLWIPGRDHLVKAPYIALIEHRGPLTQEPASIRLSQAIPQTPLHLHSATVAPLGLAWLLAVLRLWWDTAWDLVLVGKLWLGRLLETLASGVYSKSQS